MLAAVKQNGQTLKYASKKFQNDKDIVLAAVCQNFGLMKNISDELKSNYD